MPKPAPVVCPCGSDNKISVCCGRWHAGEPAPDAEALMRSRYSAYVLELRDYLLATWHVSTRPASLELEAATHWLGLSVKQHVLTGVDTAEVEFIARYRIGGGSAVRLHEHSRFVREHGRWLYLDALP